MAYESLRKLWKFVTPSETTSDACTEESTERDIPSLNSGNVLNILHKVKAETRWSYTAMWILQIPTSRLNEMGRETGSNEEKWQRAVNLWLKSCPYASWRWLIWYLDEYGEHELVDEISGYAEPLRESNLTAECLTDISKHCDLETVLRVSQRKMEVQGLIGGDLLKNKMKMITLWLETSPYATFATLSGQVFKCSAPSGDAQKILQTYWKKDHTPDPTLTVKNLIEVTKGCALKELGCELNIYVPYLYIYDNTWTVEGFFQSFLDTYPIPSWEVIICAVYELSWRSDQWLSTELITKRYLRVVQGVNLQQLCMEAISKYVSCPEDLKVLPIPERLKSRINDIYFWNIYTS